jgi:hypothetical protein
VRWYTTGPQSKMRRIEDGSVIPGNTAWDITAGGQPLHQRDRSGRGDLDFSPRLDFPPMPTQSRGHGTHFAPSDAACIAYLTCDSRRGQSRRPYRADRKRKRRCRRDLVSHIIVREVPRNDKTDATRTQFVSGVRYYGNELHPFFHHLQLGRLKAVGIYFGCTGLLSRKSRGLSWKPTHSTGIAGQSSVRGRWCACRTYQTTTSCPSTDSSLR